MFVLPMSGRTTVLAHPWGFNHDAVDEADALRAKLYRWCANERARAVVVDDLPAAAVVPARPEAEKAAMDAELDAIMGPNAPSPAEQDDLACVERLCALVNEAPLRAPPDPQPTDDEHLAAVRRAIFHVCPYFQQRERIAGLADERYLAFLASIARGNLSPSATEHEIRTAAGMRGYDNLLSRTYGDTAVRQHVADQLKKAATGCGRMWKGQWAAHKAAQRTARREARAA
jgi:hypothetical protein